MGGKNKTQVGSQVWDKHQYFGTKGKEQKNHWRTVQPLKRSLWLEERIGAAANVWQAQQPQLFEYFTLLGCFYWWIHLLLSLDRNELYRCNCEATLIVTDWCYYTDLGEEHRGSTMKLKLAPPMTSQLQPGKSQRVVGWGVGAGQRAQLGFSLPLSPLMETSGWLRWAGWRLRLILTTAPVLKIFIFRSQQERNVWNLNR